MAGIREISIGSWFGSHFILISKSWRRRGHEQSTQPTTSISTYWSTWQEDQPARKVGLRAHHLSLQLLAEAYQATSCELLPTELWIIHTASPGQWERSYIADIVLSHHASRIGLLVQGPGSQQISIRKNSTIINAGVHIEVPQCGQLWPFGWGPWTRKPAKASFGNTTVDGGNPANQLRLVGYPIIYRVLYIPGGAGFQPSTVSPDLPFLGGLFFEPLKASDLFREIHQNLAGFARFIVLFVAVAGGAQQYPTRSF